jgi:hypothetical protein
MQGSSTAKCLDLMFYALFLLDGCLLAAADQKKAENKIGVANLIHNSYTHVATE